jgi:hypothetical protein
MAPPFSTSAPHGFEWLASHLGRFTPGTHWIVGWAGMPGLHAVVKRKISCFCRESNLRHPAPWPSLYRLGCPGSFFWGIIPHLIYGDRTTTNRPAQDQPLSCRREELCSVRLLVMLLTVSPPCPVLLNFCNIMKLELVSFCTKLHWLRHRYLLC